MASPILPCLSVIGRGNVAVDLVVVDDKYATAQMLRAVKDKIKGVRWVMRERRVVKDAHGYKQWGQGYTS